MTDEDTEHLHLLSIFHFVLAGLGALCSFFPVFHLVVGIAMIRGSFPSPDAPAPPGAQDVATTMGWAFAGFAAIAILGGLTISACLALAGRNLRQRRHRTFCLVVAGLSCLSVPLGTVLGVLTIIVLSRPTVKADFAGR